MLINMINLCFGICLILKNLMTSFTFCSENMPFFSEHNWILLNNKNGSDEKCSQCACFWLKIIKGILFGVWDYCKIHSIRERSIGKGKNHKNQFDSVYLVFNCYASTLIKWYPLPKWKNDFCWFILLGLIEGKSWSKSYVSHLSGPLLRYMFVVELL